MRVYRCFFVVAAASLIAGCGEILGAGMLADRNIDVTVTSSDGECKIEATSMDSKTERGVRHTPSNYH